MMASSAQVMLLPLVLDIQPQPLALNRRWLYPFLDTKETWAPLAYGALYLAHLLFYVAVWGSFWLRGRLLWKQMLAQSSPSRADEQPGVSVSKVSGRPQQSNGAQASSHNLQAGDKKGL